MALAIMYMTSGDTIIPATSDSSPVSQPAWRAFHTWSLTTSTTSITTIEVPASCATLCTKLAELAQRKTERNGDTLDPVSVRPGGGADGWLPHTARAMAYLIAQGTSREAEMTGREPARLSYSRARRSRGQDITGTLCLLNVEQRELDGKTRYSISVAR